MNDPASHLSSLTAEVGLQFALLIDVEQDDRELLQNLYKWQQTLAEEVEWIPSVFRPDLLSLTGVDSTPCFAAFLNDGRPVFAQTVTTLSVIVERYQSLKRAAKEQPLSILQLANSVTERRCRPILSAEEPPPLSTMLVQEWLKRIVKQWYPSKSLTNSDVRIIETVSRFHEQNEVSELLEASTESLLNTTIEKCPTIIQARLLTAAVILYRQRFAGNIETNIYTKELIDFIVKIVASLVNLRDTKSGLIRTSILENDVSTTVSEQSAIARAFVLAGWVLGDDCWKIADELLSSIARSAQFGADGCRLILPDGTERGMMLTDGIQFAEAALDKYDSTGNTRWLMLADTVSSLWKTRFVSQTDWLDWFAVGHPLHGTVPALREQGIFAGISLRLGMITKNERWSATGEQFLANTGRFVLEYPRESVSLIEGMIRLFGRDLTLCGPWIDKGLTAEWRVALLNWIPDIRIDWRTPSPTPVVQIGTQIVDVANPLDLHRLFLRKERRRKA